MKKYIKNLIGLLFPKFITICWRKWYAYNIMRKINYNASYISAYPLYLNGGKYLHIDDNVDIGDRVMIAAIDLWQNQTFTPQIIIHEGVKINHDCHIGSIKRIEIGEHTTIGRRTYITDHTHGDTEYDTLKLIPRARPLYSKGGINIGKYVMIGENCAIMPGVTIGDYSIIGTNSVVTKNIPPYSIAAGNPAKVIKSYDQNE